MQLSHSQYVLLSSKAAKTELFPWQIPPTSEITHHSWNCDFLTTKQQSRPKRLEAQQCSLCSHSDICTKPQALQCHRGWCWPGILQALQKSTLPRSTASLKNPSTTLAQLGDNPFPQGSQLIFSSQTRYCQSKMLDFWLPASHSQQDWAEHVSKLITTSKTKSSPKEEQFISSQITFLAVQFNSPQDCKTPTPSVGLAAAVSFDFERLKKNSVWFTTRVKLQPLSTRGFPQ